MKFIKITISILAISLGLSNFCTAAELNPVKKFEDPKAIDELNKAIREKTDTTNLLKTTDVNEPGTDGRYPIHEAVLANNLPLVKELVENFDANINVQTKSGFTPLDFAMGNPKLDTISKYLQKRSGLTPKEALLHAFKAQVNRILRQEFPNPTTLLNLLKDYKTQYPQYVKDFVSLDFSSGSNIPLLMEIVSRNYNNTFLDLVKYLVEEMGADVNDQEVHGNTILDCCRKPYSRKDAIYKYLVSKDAKTHDDVEKEIYAKVKKETAKTSKYKNF